MMSFPVATHWFARCRVDDDAIGVGNRVEAVRWGMAHGFEPDFHRIDDWIRRP